MLTIADFSRKIIFDLNKTFPKARLQGKYVVVESDPNSVSIPVSSIYREYQEIKGSSPYLCVNSPRLEK
jgi:hypothetical protein